MKKTLLTLTLIGLFGVFLNLFGQSMSPPAFNADEAAFGYNAYSIAQTGKDEYGTFLPFRLKSFGDYKMPLYSYLDAPIVKLFGLSQDSTRALNTIAVFAMAFATYFLALTVFKNKNVAYLASFLMSASLGLHIISRHAHEAYLSVVFITAVSLFFIRSLTKPTKVNLFFFSLLFILMMFGYQSSRIFGVFFLLFAAGCALLKRKGKAILITTFILLTVLLSYDALNQPARVKNLLLFSSAGFSSKINELRAEGGSHLLYNKATIGALDIIHAHMAYFSPQFLAVNGDDNTRFGFPGMSPITPLEYGMMAVGLFYLFKNREKWRYFLVLIWVITPLGASLSWAGNSLTRSLFIIVPSLLFAAYGSISFVNDFKGKLKYIIIAGLVLTEILFSFYSWDFYLNHYPKRAVVQSSWQPGYPQLVSYIQKQYAKTSEIYITPKHGEPYIFFLFYLKYPPAQYQKQAHLSAPDEYGFGQVESFDKFHFQFVSPANKPKAIIVGYPEEFPSNTNMSQIHKITVSGKDIFWVYNPD